MDTLLMEPLVFDEPELKRPKPSPPSLGIPPLSLDPSIMPHTPHPTHQEGAPPFGLPALDFTIDPALQSSLGSPSPVSPQLPQPFSGLLPKEASPLNPWLPGGPFDHWAADAARQPSPSDRLNNVVKDLGSRDGVQVDRNGVGGQLGDWKFRGIPILPVPGLGSPIKSTPGGSGAGP